MLKGKVYIQSSGAWHEFAPLVFEGLQRYKNLRQAAEDVGVDASTLSRVSRGAEPDLLTFGRLWQWLGVSIEGVQVYSQKEAHE